MVVAVTKLPIKPGTKDKAQELIKEVAPGILKDVDGVQRVFYTADDDAVRAFGIWDSAERYSTFAESTMAKALAPFKELMAGPPDKAIHDCFFNYEK
jgi:quinol monooxygenase YgiN